MTATERDSEKAQTSNDLQDAVSRDPRVVDFDGPDDSENPMNWSPGKKTTQIIVVTSMTLLS